MNEKFNWKRFSITIILVLITACATAGTTWYFMNDANQIYKETINALQDQNNKLSKGEDDTDNLDYWAEEYLHTYNVLAGCLKMQDKIEQLEAKLKAKDGPLFAYESVKAPVNPLLSANKDLEAENKQLREGGELLIDNSRPLNYETIVYNQYCKGRRIFKGLEAKQS